MKENAKPGASYQKLKLSSFDGLHHINAARMLLAVAKEETDRLAISFTPKSASPLPSPPSCTDIRCQCFYTPSLFFYPRPGAFTHPVLAAPSSS